MELRIRRFDKSLPLPEYKTRGAAAMDLSVREDITVAPGAVVAIPLNVAIQPPAGHFVLLAARSSLHKRGLMPINGVGIIDEDYTEEYQALVRNFTDEPVEIHRGDRIAQVIVMPYEHATITEVEQLDATERGMSGSTGI